MADARKKDAAREGTGGLGGFLATVERIGNKVPHPAIIFFILIGVIAVLSAIFGLMGTAITYEFADPRQRRCRDAHDGRAQPAVRRGPALHDHHPGRRTSWGSAPSA